MARHPRLENAPICPDHESPARSMVAAAKGETYVAFRTFAEVKADPDGVVIFEGDYGGQIYLMARARFICCDESQLRRLLSELDALRWADPDGARVYFECLPVGAVVAGGMGGGVVAPEVWLHSKLPVQDSTVRDVLLGKRASIHQ